MREPFEGYELRRGNRVGDSRRSSGRTEAGNVQRDEPQGRQRGAINPQLERGENRRGGEKPRGRNEVGAWQPRHEAGPSGHVGVDARRVERRRGKRSENQERRNSSHQLAGDARSSRYEASALKTRRRTRGPMTDHFGGRKDGTTRKTSRTRTGNGRRSGRLRQRPNEPIRDVSPKKGGF